MFNYALGRAGVRLLFFFCFLLFYSIANSSTALNSKLFVRSILTRVNSEFNTDIKIEFHNRNCSTSSSLDNLIRICVPDLVRMEPYKSNDNGGAVAFMILHEASQIILGNIGNPFLPSIQSWSPGSLKIKYSELENILDLKRTLNVDAFAAKILRSFGFSRSSIKKSFELNCEIGGKDCDLDVRKIFPLRLNYAVRAFDEAWLAWAEYFPLLPLCNTEITFHKIAKMFPLNIRSRFGQNCEAYDRKIVFHALKRPPYLK